MFHPLERNFCVIFWAVYCIFIRCFALSPVGQTTRVLACAEFIPGNVHAWMDTWYPTIAWIRFSREWNGICEVNGTWAFPHQAQMHSFTLAHYPVPLTFYLGTVRICIWTWYRGHTCLTWHDLLDAHCTPGTRRNRCQWQTKTYRLCTYVATTAPNAILANKPAKAYVPRPKPDRST